MTNFEKWMTEESDNWLTEEVFFEIIRYIDCNRCPAYRSCNPSYSLMLNKNRTKTGKRACKEYFADWASSSFEEEENGS
jgi:hypothetical protein